MLGRGGGGEGGEREREKERERREKESREGAIATDWLNLQIGSRHRRNNVGRARGGQKGSLSGDAGWNAVVICSLVGEEEEEKEEEGAHRAVVRIFFWKLQMMRVGKRVFRVSDKTSTIPNIRFSFRISSLKSGEKSFSFMRGCRRLNRRPIRTHISGAPAMHFYCEKVGPCNKTAR